MGGEHHSPGDHWNKLRDTEGILRATSRDRRRDNKIDAELEAMTELARGSVQ